jgi:hypothetical protein
VSSLLKCAVTPNLYRLAEKLSGTGLQSVCVSSITGILLVAMDKAVILARIIELLALPMPQTSDLQSNASDLLQGATTLLALTHGQKSPQLSAFEAQIASAQSQEAHWTFRATELRSISLGALRTLKREVETGLIGNLRLEVTGEVLSDFLQLAKSSLDEGTEDGKNVSAVLTAAAFEDLIRRMGSAFCGIETRDELHKIVVALKNSGVLVGAQFGTVQAQLQFRNDALHADWQKIDAMGVKTVMLLVQELLLKHFS